MTNEPKQQAYRIFEESLGHDSADRLTFIEQECGGDDELRAEVEALLRADQEADGFLNVSTSDTLTAGPAQVEESAAPVSESALTERTPAPEHIGQYHIKRVIASGGMGTVYEAEQQHPKRSVAVKVIKTGIVSRAMLRRFEFESQILARLRHPNIAQVYEAGMHRDASGVTPFFAMEYIPNATPITTFARSKQLGTTELLELFIQVCEAAHHGHQKGVIHRDLKPSNVLVDTAGQAKIIDFGVARSTDSDMAVTTLQTSVGQLIGTLQYMSPEQCAADPQDLDTRSDVYALGVILYELLCDRLPYDITGLEIHQATAVIRDRAPTRLSAIVKTLRGDIETIVLKALEKDRDRRYQSAADLAQDLRRFLNSEAISARPPSMIYHVRIFARRNKALVGSVATVFAILVVASVVSMMAYLNAEDARAKAEVSRLAAVSAQAETEVQRKEAEQNYSQAKVIRDFFLGTMDFLGRTAKQNRDVTARGLLYQFGEWTSEGELSAEPLAEAVVRLTLARWYAGFGDFPLAEEHIEKALALRQSNLSENHPDVLRAKQVKAWILNQQGKFVEAEPLARDSYEGLRLIQQPGERNRGFAFGILVENLEGQQKFAEIEDVARSEWEAYRDAHGEEQRGAQDRLNVYWRALHSQGKDDEAVPLAAHYIELKKRSAGKPNARISDVHSAAELLLTCEFEDLRDVNTALELAEKADQMAKGRNPWVANNLAQAYFESGRRNEAVTTQERAISLLDPKATQLREEFETSLAKYSAPSSKQDPIGSSGPESSATP